MYERVEDSNGFAEIRKGLIRILHIIPLFGMIGYSRDHYFLSIGQKDRRD